MMQARVGDEVVWEEDVAGEDDGEVTLDLSEVVAGEDEVTLSLGLFDRTGVGNFGVTAIFSDLKAEGLEVADITAVDAWTESVRGSFVTAATPPWEPEEPIDLPLILMPSGSRSAYEKRNDDPGTAELIAAKYEMCLQFVREGRVQGVVSYCLDKTPGNEDFDAVAEIIAEFWRDFEAEQG